MSAHAYAKDLLVEQPAIGLFAELGWQTVSALEETFGAPAPGLAATLSHPMLNVSHKFCAGHRGRFDSMLVAWLMVSPA